MILLGFGCLLFGCKGGDPDAGASESERPVPTVNDIDYDEMAKGFCECMEPMFEFQSKLMKLLEAGDQAGVEALRDEAMKVQEDGESCIVALEAKYGVVQGEEAEAKATEALEKACPEIMELMGATTESLEE